MEEVEKNAQNAEANTQPAVENSADELQRNKEIANNLAKILADNPELGEVLLAMKDGDISFVEAVASVLSPEEMQVIIDEAADGTPFSERLKKKNAAKAAKEKGQKEAEANFAKSWEAIENFCKKMGMNEAATEGFAKAVTDWFQIFADGKITEAECEKLYNMLNYDADVAAARADGEKAGMRATAKAIKGDKSDEKVVAGIGTVGKGGGAPITPEAKSPYESDPIYQAVNSLPTQKRELRQG